MKISSILCLGLLLAGVSLEGNLTAATTLTGDQNIVSSSPELGSLSIAGDLTTAGAIMSLGTTSASTQAIQWTYYPSTTPPALALDMFDATGRIMWRQNAAATAVEKMELNGTNQLMLFAPTYNPASPNAGIVTLTPSLATGGSTITLDGQQVLTQGIGDARYLQLGLSGWSLGSGSSASGSGSLAFGSSAVASGDQSSAFGANVTAYNMSETVLGSYNLAEPGAHPTSHVATDNLFVIGNGTTGTLSNAFVITWGGDVTMNGNAHVTKVLTADQGGHFGDTVHLEPRGGLSMGAYTYDPGSP